MTARKLKVVSQLGCPVNKYEFQFRSPMSSNDLLDSNTQYRIDTALLIKSAILLCFFSQQQLMRERQQMASRPFASVDVALEAAGGEQTDPLRGPLEVMPTDL
ncbi:UNVERIFIED_CONTAM: hypothetical protein FKN15_057390 [Acipenser sinensis]